MRVLCLYAIFFSCLILISANQPSCQNPPVPDDFVKPGDAVKVSSTIYYTAFSCDDAVINMEGEAICEGEIIDYLGNHKPVFAPPPAYRNLTGKSGILNARGMTDPQTSEKILLMPFKTIAAHTKLFKTYLYVKKLDGMVFTFTDAYKNNQGKIIKSQRKVKHDGCLKIIDTGSAFSNPNSSYFRGYPTKEKFPIDLYIGLRSNKNVLKEFADQNILKDGVYDHNKCKSFQWRLQTLHEKILEEGDCLNPSDEDRENSPPEPTPDPDWPDDDWPDDDWPDDDWPDDL